MKKKIVLMLSAGALVAASFSAGALAYIQYAPGATDTAMTTNELTVELNEAHVNPLTRVSGKAMPGDSFDQVFYATNTGDYTEYVSIALDKYWTADPQGGADGKIAPIAVDSNAAYLSYINGIDSASTELSVSPGITDTADWIFVNEDANFEQVIAYYKKPLAPGERTSNVIDAIKIANIQSEEQNIYTRLSIQIDASASAVQQIGDVQAISDEWGRTATIDADGNLTSIQ